MRKRMGTFYTNCRVENQVDRKKSAEVPKMLVDTGAEFTWINAGTLKKIGVKREKKDYAFLGRLRLNDRPRALSGRFVEVSCWTDQEVMATMGRLRKIPAFIVCGLICGCQTTNTARRDATEQPDSSTFVHSFTKFSFPESIGTFHRVEVRKYDRDGRDVGVGYNSPTPIAATVFIYPGPKDFALLPAPKLENVSEALLDQHFQVCKQDILRNHSDGKMIAESPCQIVQGKNRIEGKRASFSLSYKFGSLPQESVSELYVFLIDPRLKFLVTDREFVKYRFTYPAARKTEAEPEVSAFMNRLVWPAK